MMEQPKARAGSTPHHPRRWHATVWRCLLIIACFPLGATVLSFGGRFHWWLDLFTHFRVQYGISLSILCIAFLIARRRTGFIACTSGALVNLAFILPLYAGGTTTPATSTPPIRAMLANVHTHNGDPLKVGNLIAQINADIVLLQEVNQTWLSRLRMHLESYPFRIEQPREDNFGIALYSKVPLNNIRVVHPGDVPLPVVIADVESPQGVFRLVGVHTMPPVSRNGATMRNTMLRTLPQYVRDAPTPVMVLGDLNITAWSHHFRQLLHDAALIDSARGFGIQPTWPTDNPFMRIPIDQCLHTQEIVVRQRRVGPNTGSDHFPLIVDFAVSPSHPG